MEAEFVQINPEGHLLLNANHQFKKTSCEEKRGVHKNGRWELQKKGTQKGSAIKIREQGSIYMAGMKMRSEKEEYLLLLIIYWTEETTNLDERYESEESSRQIRYMLLKGINQQ